MMRLFSNILRKSLAAVQRNKYLLCMVVCVLLLCGRAWFLSMESGNRFVQVRFSAPLSSPVQLHYDQGSGFNDHDSVYISKPLSTLSLLGIIPIPAHRVTWLGGTPFGAYRFHITPEHITALLLLYAPIDKAQLIDVSVCDGLGAQLQSHPLQLGISSEITPMSPVQKQTFALHVDIPLPNSLELHQGRPLFGFVFLLRIAVEGLLLLSTVILSIFLFSSLNRLTDRFRLWLNNWLRKSSVQDWLVFLLMTILFFLGYRQLNDHLFPLFFWKLFIVFLIFLCVFYIKRFGLSILRLKIVIILLLMYIAVITISIAMHGAALDGETTMDVVAFNNGVFHGELINRGKQIDALFNKASNSDQTQFLYFFPVLLFVSIGIFSFSSSTGWRKLLMLPLLAIPNLIFAWYSRENMVLDIRNYETYLLQGIVVLRIFCFLLFPLCLLGIFVVRNIPFRLFYAFLAVITLWVSWAYHGRGALLGLVVFFVALPGIKIWVDKDRLSTRSFAVLAATTFCAVTVLLISFTFPQFHRALNTVLPDHTVQTGHAIVTGIFNGKEPDSARAEMNRQAIRLIKEAPLGGWGPGGFPNNADRMRVMHNEPNGVSHVITSIYLLFATTYGLPGLLIFFFIIILPLHILWRVQGRIEDTNERWAVGILSAISIIMLLLFKTNPHLSFVEINWLYCLFLGYLISIGFRYGYQPELKNWCMWSGGILLLLVLSSIGSYTTSFGRQGYAAVTEKMLRQIRGDAPASPQGMVFDSKRSSTLPAISNTLITTRATPWRLGYTTSEYLMDYGQITLPDMHANTVYCIELTARKEAINYLFLWADVYVDGNRYNAFSFNREGSKLLFYDLPGNDSKQVTLHLRARWSIPYHRDDRREIEPIPYLPDHPDFKHLGLQLHVTTYEKT